MAACLALRRWPILITAFVTSCVIHEGVASCSCKIPTPCAGQKKCELPVLSKVSQCPASTTDCRNSSGQLLCDVHVRPEDRWCCWTACSSMNLLRKCPSSPPHGFEFDETGKRDSRECHHPLNVREECCLRQHKIMKAVQPKSHQCPKLGVDLSSLFETVDGNGQKPADLIVSANEVLNSLQWLKAKGYLFLAEDFEKIDIDKNMRVSWYELEFFCGHVGMKLPPTDITKIKATEFLSILSNPLYVAAILSSLILGELVGLVQAVLKHAMGWSDANEGCAIKIAYTALAHIWPFVYTLIQWAYFFTKIEWEVCDDKGHEIRSQYAFFLAFYTGVRFVQFFNWSYRRRAPLSPSLDLERRIFLQEIQNQKFGKAFKICFVTVMIWISGFTLYRGLCFGTVFDVNFTAMENCLHEEPDMQLLYNVNEKFFLWNLFQASFLQAYLAIGTWAIANKSYVIIPQNESIVPRPGDEKFKEAEKEERAKWRYFE